jgi:hypothetical protein
MRDAVATSRKCRVAEAGVVLGTASLMAAGVVAAASSDHAVSHR